ncbi:MAG: asparagine synthase (glutamine-hydrolyzing) [Candidatus Gracilibacteria bacterium]
MCGIAGIVTLNPNLKLEESSLKRMVQALHHRGPDDSGIYMNPDSTAGLGSARLAILDLSPHGHMPMSNKNKTIWIVFNGEIYNFQENTDALMKKGYVFRSHSDTEVLLALYEEYGVDCLKYLRGMFSFAIWDEPKKRLFCARDRAGKKPFKYFFDGKRFVFASELKAIIQDPSIPRRTDFNAINHYLSYQCIPSPMTGFMDIHKLPPAHYLLLEKGQLKIQRYWQLDYREKLALSEEEWVERITHELDESVRLRLISDVPLGAFLSGGIDSSLVVALMSQHSPHPVKTFSIGFNEKKYNELKYARLVAQKFETEHHEFTVEPQVLDLFDELVYGYEEPYADSSALPTYCVSKLTRQFVTVALNGDGGDENFFGYPWFNVHKFSLYYKKVPSFLRKGFFTPLSGLFFKIFKTTLTERAYRFNQKFNDNLHRLYFEYRCFFNEDQKKSLFTKEFEQKLSGPSSTDLTETLFSQILASDPMDQALGFDFNSYLPDALLVKVDIASMMNTLECRSPFLDHHFLELTSQIPSSLNFKHFQKKYLLKKVAKQWLPPEIIYRKKQGFRVPIEHWFKDSLKDFVQETLLHGELIKRNIVKKDAIENLFRMQKTTKINLSNQIWALLTLDRWFSLFDLKD